MTLIEARSAAAKVQADVVAGLDPGAGSKDAKTDSNEQIFAKVINIYLDRRADTMRTGDEIRRVLNAVFFPKFGKRKIDEITKAEIAIYMDAVADHSGPAAANRYLAYLRAAFSWLVRRGLVDSNPAINIPSPGGSLEPRDRVLAEDEIKKIWLSKDSQIRSMTLIAILTGQRRTPIGAMRWEDLKLDGPELLWQIPAADMKMARPHDVPLSPQVVDIIKAQPKIGPYVFGKDGAQPFSGFSRAMERFRIETCTSGWTLHDCRRTATTYLAKLKVPAEVMRAILDHKPPSSDMLARVYNRHSYVAESRTALEALGRKINEIGTRKPTTIK
jgi:integrase